MPLKKSKFSRDYHLIAIAAARLRSEGHKQTAIAKQLNISQPEVSRALEFAGKQGFLIPEPRLVRDKIRDDDWREIERLYFTDSDLLQRLKGWAPAGVHLEVRVMAGSGDEFCRAASRRLIELVPQASLFGIMWGRTVKKLIEGIEARQHLLDRARYKNFRCIPLCGDPTHLMNLDQQEYSASHLAATLERLLTGAIRSDLPSLSGVPAYICRRFFRKDSEERRVLTPYIQSIPGYSKIFGPLGVGTGGRPLINQVGALLTGVGIITDDKVGDENLTATFLRERFVQEDVGKEELDRLVYGDIAGWLIAKEDLSATDQGKVQEFNEGWIGIHEDHLRLISRQAKPDGAPGIILVASGQAKARMVKAVVNRGLVNQLLINDALSKALKSFA